MRPLMSKDKVDLKDAQSAFNTFFDLKNPQKGKTLEADSNPANKILNQVKQENTPPNKRFVTKVDAASTTKDNTESMSVDEAETIVDARKDFNEILKELKIKHSDLFSIIDSFLEKGYYEDKYTVKSLEYVFRTKKVHSVDSIHDALDGSKFVTPTATGQLLLERSLAASLVYFKQGKNPGRIFEHDSEEDDAKALEFVRKELSTPIYSIMGNKLRRFELLTGLASREEAIDHFLAHTQD
jgi:DNA-binding MarR family transcriptional regulator